MSQVTRDDNDRHGRRDDPPGPVDAIDGVPDRAAAPRAWKLVLLAVVFALWVAFLLYCQLAE